MSEVTEVTDHVLTAAWYLGVNAGTAEGAAQEVQQGIEEWRAGIGAAITELETVQRESIAAASRINAAANDLREAADAKAPEITGVIDGLWDLTLGAPKTITDGAAAMAMYKEVDTLLARAQEFLGVAERAGIVLKVVKPMKDHIEAIATTPATLNEGGRWLRSWGGTLSDFHAFMEANDRGSAGATENAFIKGTWFPQLNAQVDDTMTLDASVRYSGVWGMARQLAVMIHGPEVSNAQINDIFLEVLRHNGLTVESAEALPYGTELRVPPAVLGFVPALAGVAAARPVVAPTLDRPAVVGDVDVSNAIRNANNWATAVNVSTSVGLIVVGSGVLGAGKAATGPLALNSGSRAAGAIEAGSSAAPRAVSAASSAGRTSSGAIELGAASTRTAGTASSAASGASGATGAASGATSAASGATSAASGARAAANIGKTITDASGNVYRMTAEGWKLVGGPYVSSASVGASGASAAGASGASAAGASGASAAGASGAGAAGAASASSSGGSTVGNVIKTVWGNKWGRRAIYTGGGLYVLHEWGENVAENNPVVRETQDQITGEIRDIWREAEEMEREQREQREPSWAGD